jgi:hypothetical protein
MVTVSLAPPVAVGAKVTFILQEPLVPAPVVLQPLASTVKGAAYPVTVTLPASMTEYESVVRVNASVVKLAPTSTVPDVVAAAVTPETPVPVRVGEPVAANGMPELCALIVTDSGVAAPVTVGANVTFIVQDPGGTGTPPEQPVSTEKGVAMPFTTTVPGSMTVSATDRGGRHGRGLAEGRAAREQEN